MPVTGQRGTIFQAMEFPDYIYREFPKMLYSRNGSILVDGKEAQAELTGQWWLLPSCEGEPIINKPAPKGA